MRQANKNEKC